MMISWWPLTLSCPQDCGVSQRSLIHLKNRPLKNIHQAEKRISSEKTTTKHCLQQKTCLEQKMNTTKKHPNLAQSSVVNTALEVNLCLILDRLLSSQYDKATASWCLALRMAPIKTYHLRCYASAGIQLHPMTTSPQAGYHYVLKPQCSNGVWIASTHLANTFTATGEEASGRLTGRGGARPGLDASPSKLALKNKCGTEKGPIFFLLFFFLLSLSALSAFALHSLFTYLKHVSDVSVSEWHP